MMPVMRKIGYWFVTAVVFLCGCGPHVTLTHTVPAPYNLGLIEKIVLVEALGYSDDVREVVSRMADISRYRGFYQFIDARSARMPLRLLKSTKEEKEAERFREEWNAGVWAGLEVLDCRIRMLSKAVKEKDDKKNEITVTKYWHEASCEVKVDLVNASDGREIASFGVVGTGETDPAASSGPTEAGQARVNALASAAEQAVDRFTPRRVSEYVSIDKDAPLGKEGGKLVSDKKLVEARQFWEEALDSHANSAPFLYNLGAVCDALGDTQSARKYFAEAIRLAPDESKYRRALSALEQREADARELREQRP